MDYCDVFDKTKTHFQPNYICISFVYLTLEDMSVSRRTVIKRPVQNIKNPKIPLNSLKRPLLDILNGTCDQHRIATMASPPLAVRSKICNKHHKMKFIYRLLSRTIKIYVFFNSIRKIQ
jgi:hypothetical protein